MEMEVKETLKIEDGVHAGIIKDVTYRTKPYEYTDVHIEMENGIVLKAGYATYMSETSDLGLLMKRFGILVGIGLKCDPDMLKGKACQFVTTTSGKYANVVKESVKPK